MYFAHISEDGRKQSVQEHLENTAKLAASFAKDFRLEEQAYIVGLLHDIGKYSQGFQKRLLGGPKVDHSSAGAFEALKRNMTAEAFCIAGHHSGIPNGGSRTSLEGSSLMARMKRSQKGEIESYASWENEISVPNYTHWFSLDGFEASVRIRMLFSCLVDADYIDTARFMGDEQEQETEFNVEQMNQKLMEYTAGWYPPKTKLNRLRCEILDHVIAKGKESPRGIYTLTVPTGGGKTVASLAYAIEHAKKNGLKRIIYVIPYTSIIEQTAEVFRSILGDDVVLEHHSNVEYVDDEDNCKKLKAIENWDKPIIVTTSVQFFESFYKNKSSSSRKLHNVANSIVIFDEAQMLPLSYMKPCVGLMSELVKNFFCTVILCSATQPSLGRIISEFIPDYQPYELCPTEYYYNDLFKRVNFKFDGTYSIDLLANKLNLHNQVLCIVNSRKAAQELYEHIGETDGAFHLSTNMYAAHRRLVLKIIRGRLESGLTCRVIATSLIEAGVDVDFPCVYRQIAGLDSLLQAGGRCNREGKRRQEDSIVTVFDLECGSPELFSANIGATEYVLEKNSDITSKEAISEYFSALFYLKGEDTLDQYRIIDQLKTNNLPFEDIAKQFNLIDSNTRTLYVENDENKKLVDKARLGILSKMEKRKISLFGVNIYEYQYKALREHHALEELENGNCILNDSGLYHDDVGLKIEIKTGEAIMI